MNSKKKRLYFAAPLFNEMERAYNSTICGVLRKRFDVFLPQQDGHMMVDMIREGMPVAKAKMVVFGRDVNAIKTCDILLIVLNGRTVDEGAAFELGLAYALGKECWALKTDIRQLLQAGDNPMIEGAIKRAFCSTEELFEFVDGEYAQSSNLSREDPDLRVLGTFDRNDRT